MSWSINLGNNGDNFKTLEEIRAHVRSTTENIDKVADEIFPSDVKIPTTSSSSKQKKPVVRKKAVTTTKKSKKIKEKTPIEDHDDENDNDNDNDNDDENNDDNDDNDDINNIEADYKNNDTNNSDTEENENDDKKENNKKSKKITNDNNQHDDGVIDNSDLKIATESIIKGLKILNNKVSSVSTVLEDVQAASINRQYSSLIKNIDLLKSIAECGKSQVIRKKVKNTKK
ncbi:late transcription factor VLTF-4 [Sheeppox virus]|uniref:Late transcription factor VLTF-4 n=2 Tax=Sheeppox virus TaxID=10266 RepID=A0A3F2YKN4_SHEVT|nr:late transcription factor VLTF-4 [Sheeppox virus]QEJ80117.1 late transcription factor [Sheeppox virus]QQG63172.1 late transcription factor [Sheeppox virus]